MTNLPPPLPIDHPAWRLLHADFLDALGQQSQRCRDAVLNEVGLTLDGFQEAVADQLLVVQPAIRDDGLYYAVSIRVSDGLATLCRSHVSRLGMPEELLDVDQILAAYLGFIDVTVPDDASEIT